MQSRLQRPQHCEQATSFSIFDVLIQVDHMHISDENFTSGSVWEVYDNVRLDEIASRQKTTPP